MKAFFSSERGLGTKSFGFIVFASVMSGLLSPVIAPAQTKTPTSTEPAQAASTGRPNAAELESWRNAILATPRPKNGCFTATYPEKQWREAACKTPPHKIHPPLPRQYGGMTHPNIVGGQTANGPGQDWLAQVTGYISQAEGSFDPGTSVSSECTVQCPNGICPANATCTAADPANAYTLQLNTNSFSTETCAGSVPIQGTDVPCQGAQQFAYDSPSGQGYVQYWLINYGPPGTMCPKPRSARCAEGPAQSDGWCPIVVPLQAGVSSGWCVVNSMNGGSVGSQPITSLSQMRVTGTVAGVNGAANDEVAVTVGDTVTPVSGNNYFHDLGSGWQEAEFNVFGDANSDQAVFNAGSTVVVRTSVTSGTTSAPIPQLQTFTNESNNLNLANPACPIGGASPAILFTESNVGATSICACPPGEKWIQNSAACGPPPAMCTPTGCVSSANWQYSLTCTGMDVGIVYNGGCTSPAGEPQNCYAGFNGNSTVTAGWGGAAGPPTWYTPAQQGSPTVCTVGFGQQNCNTYTIAGLLPACPTEPPSPGPICPNGERYCTKFSPPLCVPEKLCLVQPAHP
jgi:hypothetical protein